MNRGLFGRNVLRAIAILTLGGFLLWLAVLYLFWRVLGAAGGAAPDFWTMTEALSTAAAVATVLMAGFFAYRELNETTNSRYMAVADSLFEELNSPDSIRARRWIFQNLPPDPVTALAALPQEGRDAIKQVLNSLDRVAFLTQAGWIPNDLVMPWMNPMIFKAWIKLKPYVDFEAARRNEPEYYRQVRGLAERCLAWRTAHGLSTEVTWVEHAL